MSGQSLVNIVDSAPRPAHCLHKFWYVDISQVIRFEVADTFLQCIEFQTIITFKKQMYVILVIYHNDN